MTSIEEKIKELEDEIFRTQKNKATEHHIGSLRGKIAKLKEEMVKKASQGKGGEGYAVKKQGDRTVVLVGFPSVGKSTLLNRLTDARSKVAAYDFTTLTAIPGMMYHKQAEIQMVDLPGIIKEASAGKGGGKQIINVVRNADLIIILLDAEKAKERLLIIQQELYNAGIRLDKTKPNILIKKKSTGGLNLQTTVPLTKTTMETVKGLFREFRLPNADVIIRQDVGDEEIIDSILENRHYCPSLIVVNKCDLGKSKIENAINISAEKNIGLEKLRDGIWNKLDIVRVFTKEPGKETDYEEPMIVRHGTTVKNIAKKIGKKRFRYARVWGRSAKFNGQKVGENHELKDNDVVSFY